MSKTKREIATHFSGIEHHHFNLTSFRPMFIKAAWKAYRDIESDPVSIEKFQQTVLPLYDTLFLGKGMELSAIMKELHSLLKNQSRTEQFLTDTFYIVLNHYIKSLYGTSGGLAKIISFATAIEHFILSTPDSESFFIFEDTLIDALEGLRQQEQSLMLLNTYYGVPIQYRAKIVHTDAHSVLIKAHPRQETAAILQNGIYLLKNDQFLNDVYAAVSPKMVNGERLLELTRFDQLKTSLFHRQNIRVQIPNTYILQVAYNRVDHQCQLFDISLGGVAATSRYAHRIEKNGEVTLCFPDDIMEKMCEVKGTLILKSSYEGGYKYHFKIDLTKQQEADLGKYIVKREQEIIKMLRDEIV